MTTVSKNLSERGIALTGYVVPGCVEDVTWMLWENSSVVAVVAAVAVIKGLKTHFWEISLGRLAT